MAKHNIAKMTTATTGTGTVTLGSAVSGYLSFAGAGVADGELVEYVIREGANTEVGVGTYTSAGTTLSRTTVYSSTNSGNKISLAGAATVAITAPALDGAFSIYADTTGTTTMTNASTNNVVTINDFYYEEFGISTLGTDIVTMDVSGLYQIDIMVKISSVSAFNGKCALIYTSDNATYTFYRDYVTGDSITADYITVTIQAEYLSPTNTIDLKMNNNLGSTVTYQLMYMTIKRLGAW